MKQLWASIIVLCIVATISWVVVASVRTGYNGRTYTVSQVIAGLRQNPNQWLGRTLVVRGRAVVHPCPRSCPYRPEFIIDSNVAFPEYTFCESPHSLQLGWMDGKAIVRAEPFIDFYLNVPVVGRLVQRQVGGEGIYRIQLRRSSSVCNGASLNYEAIALDRLR